MASVLNWQWKRGEVEWVGWQSDRVEPATLKQTKNTCWAAGMAVACGILVGGVFEDEAYWTGYASDNSGRFGSSGAITYASFVDMAQTMQDDLQVPVTAAVFQTADMPMHKVSGLLRQGAVVLLHSANHIVVLSAMGFEPDGTIKYRVTDTTPGQYQTWTQNDIDGYGVQFVSIVRRK